MPRGRYVERMKSEEVQRAVIVVQKAMTAFAKSVRSPLHARTRLS